MPARNRHLRDRASGHGPSALQHGRVHFRDDGHVTMVSAAVSRSLHSVEAHMPILAGVEMVATSMADICWPVGTVPAVTPFTFALIVSTMGVQMASTVGDKMI